MKPNFFLLLFWIVISISADANTSSLVTFSQFTGENYQNSILLKWSTSKESNSKHFEIQRSSHNNPDDFTSVGIVAASGQSVSLRNYNFLDEFPSEGIAYYRIKQVDHDNSFVYSAIIEVRYQPVTIVRSFLNPVHDVLFVSFNIFPSDVSDFHLINMFGVTILRGRISNVALYLPIANLSAGTYMLAIRMCDQRENLKIIKQ